MSADINQFISLVVDYLSERDLIVSPEKSTATLFIPDTKEVKIKPEVKIQGQAVKLDKNPKLWGVTFDTMFNYTKHIKNSVATAEDQIRYPKSPRRFNLGTGKRNNSYYL